MHMAIAGIAAQWIQRWWNDHDDVHLRKSRWGDIKPTKPYDYGDGFEIFYSQTYHTDKTFAISLIEKLTPLPNSNISPVYFISTAPCIAS